MSLSKTVSHEYDPKIVFHSHSSNVPQLNTWIDQLIQLNEHSLPKQSAPNTNNLVEGLQRYDAVYKELLRQTSIFSEPVTKMLTKVWAGVLKLMDYMIKSYHRYVKHTSHLQSQAQTLLSERQKGEAANKIQKDEFDLERAHLRARIRNLESEVDAIKSAKRTADKENNKLRRIIDVYIKSTDLNDPVWDVMEEDETKTSSNLSAVQLAMLAQVAEKEPVKSTFKRKDSVDASKMQLKTLNRLDIELNEILSNVLKEENRQRLLMSDVMKLVDKNKDIFTRTADDDGASVAGSVKPVPVLKRGDTMGSVGSTKSQKVRRAADWNKRTVAVQIDDKDRLGVIEETEPKAQEQVQLGVAPLAPLNVLIPGADQPYLLRALMTTYPKVLRVPPAAWACQVIMSIYYDKIETDAEREAKGHPKMSLPAHTYNYFRETLGLALAADVQIAQLLKACESHVRKQPRVTLFANQMGLFNKDDLPPLDVRDTDFVLNVLSCLIDRGELCPQVDRKKAVAKLGESLKPDISRQAALQTVTDIFEKWLPDGGEDYLIKVRSMAHSDKGSKFVDLDEFIDILMEPWHHVRRNWEDHAKFLFHDNCSVHRILQEATFANDDGTVASDTILVEVHKASASDCIRRPLRLFQKTESAESEFGGAQPVGNPNKESVCEVINFKQFINAMLIINPEFPMAEIESMFEEALDHAHDSVLRSLDLMWMKCVESTSGGGGHKVLGTDGERAEARKVQRDYWVNLRNSISQWTKPFSPHVFRAQDIEMESFVAVLLRRDVFPKSPMVDMLNMAPKDMWPNADMFYKQVKERRKKERIAANKAAGIAAHHAGGGVSRTASEDPYGVHKTSSLSRAPSEDHHGAMAGHKLAGGSLSRVSSEDPHGPMAAHKLASTSVSRVVSEEASPTALPALVVPKKAEQAPSATKIPLHTTIEVDVVSVQSDLENDDLTVASNASTRH